MTPRAIPLFPAAAERPIAVVGDVMLDRFLYGDVERISPEAPVPVLRRRQTRSMLGGAGNVARNIAALGGQAVLVGLLLSGYSPWWLLLIASLGNVLGFHVQRVHQRPDQE